MPARKHRHFLGLPLLAATLALALLGSSVRFQATVTTTSIHQGELIAQGADRTIILDGGTSVFLHEDGVLQDDDAGLTLMDGVALFSAAGLQQIHVGDHLLSLFHGAALITSNRGTVTVYALTSPVLVAHDAFRVIIPQGMQGSWSADAPLPSTVSLQGAADAVVTFSMLTTALEHDQREALARLPVSVVPSLQESRTLPDILLPFALPAEQQRTEESKDLSRLATLQRALRAGDAETARVLLQSDDVRRQLTATDLPTTVFPTLLASAASLPSASQLLLQIVPDADLWLLASFHPLYRAAAWETPGPVTMNLHARQLRWLQLPSSDVGDAVLPLSVERWQSQVERYLTSQDDAGRKAFLHALLSSLKGYSAFLAHGQLPERQSRYAEALQAITAPYTALLTITDKTLLAPWLNVGIIAPYSDPPPAPVAAAPVIGAQVAQSSSASSSYAEPFDAAAVEAQAKKIFQEAGALFTAQTTITAESATTVTVASMLFATMDGEHSYDFTFDLAASQIRHVRRDGLLQPFPLSLSAFRKWASGGR